MAVKEKTLTELRSLRFPPSVKRLTSRENDGLFKWLYQEKRKRSIYQKMKHFI